jgi:hypothetical protein
VTMINPNVDKVFQRSGFLQKSSSDAPSPWNVRRRQGAEDYGHDLTSNRQLSRECEEHTQSDPPLTLDQAHSSTRNWSDPTPAGVMHMDQEWWRQPMKQSTQQSTLPVSTEEPQGRRDQDYSLLVTEISELEEVIAICERRLYVESSGELFLPIAEYEMNPGHANLQRDLVFSRKEDFLEAVQELIERLQHYERYMTSTSIYHFAGGSRLPALYSFRPVEELARPMLTPQLLREFAVEAHLDPEKVAEFLSPRNRSSAQDPIWFLTGCTMMAEVYKLLPGATVSTLLVNQTLVDAKWLPKFLVLVPMTREQAFAGIAMFESGTCNVDPQSLGEVFALSSGNSLFVAGGLLCDPFEVPASNEVRRVIGNVGRAGLTFLISPPKVKIREADAEKWVAINHNEFDGKPVDHFEHTSIHLSFTEYEIPLVTEGSQRHIIDRPVVLVETLISIHDGGQWVGEADILKALSGDCARATGCDLGSGLHAQHKAAFVEQLQKDSRSLVTSIENWDELIEAPSTGRIAVRAHGNWLARLAATAICVRLNIRPFILPKEVCWQCCQAACAWLDNDRVGLIY